jgi:hypothetical protein
MFFFWLFQKKQKKAVAILNLQDSLSNYFTLANDLVYLEKRLQYNQKAFEIVTNNENDSLNRVNLFKVANRFYNINDWKDLRKQFIWFGKIRKCK